MPTTPPAVTRFPAQHPTTDMRTRANTTIYNDPGGAGTTRAPRGVQPPPTPLRGDEAAVGVLFSPTPDPVDELRGAELGPQLAQLNGRVAAYIY